MRQCKFSNGIKMSDTKIYHNPKCSKSRQTLELIRGRGIEPEIILYLEGLLTSEDIASIIEMLKIRPLEIIRKNEADFKESFTVAGHLNDEQLIKLMCLYPKVIERPIVINKGMAVIGRPPENVLKIL